jgi:hypothetical protein
VVHNPDGVSESLETVEFLPLTGFGLIHFKLDIFTDIVSATSQYEHESTDEQGRVLVSSEGFLCARLVRSLNPVPSAISVAT